MISAYRILWGEGMFLRPQHFQHHTIHQELLASQIAALCNAYPYGLKELSLDAAALTNGMLRLSAAFGVMVDGTVINIPGVDPAPPIRNLADIASLGTSSLVYLCLPSLNEFGGNCAEPGEATPRPVRYSVETVRSPDMFTSGLEADLSVLRHKLILLTDGENRDGYYSLPIARIVLAPSGHWTQDDQYIPPLLDIHASELLVALARRLLDMLFVKSQALAAKHRERARHIAEFSSADISSFWLLHTVNRSFPIVSHALKAPVTHPEKLYLALSELYGELLTFSSAASLNNIPAYDHESLSEIFTQLEQAIHELLDTVISSRFLVIPLSNPRPSLYVGRLESDNLLDDADFYLSIQSDQATSYLIDTVPQKLKVGSPEDVEKILNSALPGVRISHARQTPSAIPVRIGNLYFALEPGSAIYDRMKAARSICIYVPHTLERIKVELLAVFH